MSAITDVLHKVVNYLPWRNESELNDIREAIDTVEAEIDTKIKQFISPAAGVTTPADTERATTEVADDAGK